MKKKTILQYQHGTFNSYGRFASLITFQGCEESYSLQITGEEHAKLTFAPMVPPPIAVNIPPK
jgi:hypothetical protein